MASTESTVATTSETWMPEEYDPGLVSVIVPTYNRAHLIVETLDSVFAQTYRPIELLIIDDGSTDDTAAVIQNWAHIREADDFRIRFLQQVNQGAPAARNHGLVKSRGEFIQFLDSDDLLCRDKLQRQVSYFYSNPTINVVHEGWVQGADWKRCRQFSRRQRDDHVEALLNNEWFPNFAYLVRRSLACKAGGWDEQLVVAQDFDYFLRMAIADNSFLYIPGVAGLFKWHDGPRVSRQSATDRANAVYSVLERAEGLMLQHEAFTRKRAKAMAERYWHMAKRCIGNDMSLAKFGVAQARRISSPWFPQSKLNRVAVLLLGDIRGAILCHKLRSVRGDAKRILRHCLKHCVYPTTGTAIAHDFRTAAGAGIKVPEAGPNCGRTSEKEAAHVQR